MDRIKDVMLVCAGIIMGGIIFDMLPYNPNKYGTLADWIGNVSIPVVLAWASRQYTLQKDRQAKEAAKQREKEAERQRQREKLITVLKVLLDLDTLINYELPMNPNQNNYQQTYQKVLINNLDLLVRARNEIYACQGEDVSGILFGSLKTVIDMVRNYPSMSWDNIKYADDALKEAEDTLQKEYDRLRSAE